MSVYLLIILGQIVYSSEIIPPKYHYCLYPMVEDGLKLKLVFCWLVTIFSKLFNHYYLVIWQQP